MLGEDIVGEEDKIKKALLKKALGYNANEVVEEYTYNEDGELKLSKKKITKKHFSPDIAAVKVLLDKYYKTYEEEVLSMTDEKLLQEKKSLEQQLREDNDGIE